MQSDYMSNPKNVSVNNGKQFIQDSFAAQQAVLKAQLDLSKTSITHMGERGEVDERHVIEILRRYLPDRYSVESGIVIDSQGGTSDQIDVIIFDRQYTPTLLDQHEHKYIPAEAVYAVFEAKPTIDKGYLEYAAGKAKSVRDLHRTSLPVVHSDGVKPPKPLFDILAGIIAAEIDWKDGFGAAFMQNHALLLKPSNIDCGLAVSGHAFDCFNGGYAFASGKNALVFFLFRLLQKLQSLGTVAVIDWNAYASQLGNHSTEDHHV
jgi:hypothetical protein